MTYSISRVIKPVNSGPGWPNKPQYWLGLSHSQASNDPCGKGALGWGWIWIPHTNATGARVGISGGWITGRVLDTYPGLTAAGCYNINYTCGTVDPYVWVAKSTYPQGLMIDVWGALEAGLWTSSVALTIHRECSFATAWGPVQAASKASCNSVYPPYDGPPSAPLSPVAYTSSSPCTDTSIPTNTLTVYDDGSFTVT